MPSIKITLNRKIDDTAEERIKEALGDAISLLPGKSEKWLMLVFADECHMYFGGNGDNPMALVEVSLFGSAGSDAYQKLTAAVTEILHENLSITPDQIYVKYSEISHWGWNGSNF